MALGRGGFPKVYRVASTTQGITLAFPLCGHLTVQADAACQLFFSQADFTAGTNYITLGATATYDGPAACRGVWLKGAANVTVVAYGQN